MKGKFIVIEGLDGSGKSTQIELLKKKLEKKGIDNKFIHFPMLNQGFYGNLIAEFLRGEFGSIEQVHPKLVALLFANDRLEHISKIKNWLEEGYCVLADRYVNSNIAFQCAKIKDDKKKQQLKEWILDYEFNINKLPFPDIYIFLDVPFSSVEKNLTENRSGNDRDYLNGEIDIHEASISFQKQVYETYKMMSIEQENFISIDCSDSEGQFLDKEIINNKILSQINS